MQKMYLFIMIFFVIHRLSQSLQQDCNCQECKNINGVDWSIVSISSYRCPIGCLYVNTENKQEMCYCDPGPIQYEECPYTPASSPPSETTLPGTTLDGTSPTGSPTSSNTVMPCETDDAKRIFGGGPAAAANWQVALLPKTTTTSTTTTTDTTKTPKIDPSNIFCGGSLITRETVITAAHCVYHIVNGIGKKKDKDTIEAWIGLLNVKDLKNAYKKDIKNIILPDGYTKDDYPSKHDIAVLTIEKIVVDKETYNPICLPPAEDKETYAGKCATTTGWGYISQNPNKDPTILQVLESKSTNTVRVLAQKDCVDALKPITIFDYNICFSYVQDKGICDGDSGGPLVFTNKKKSTSTNYLIGVSSWAQKDCSLKDPSVYTRVTAYLDFIKVNKKGAGC